MIKQFLKKDDLSEDKLPEHEDNPKSDQKMDPSPDFSKNDELP